MLLLTINKASIQGSVIHLEIDGVLIAKGEGFSKKVAEQNAAMNAQKELGIP